MIKLRRPCGPRLRLGERGVPATAPADWIEASQVSFDNGQPYWNPPIVPVAEVRDAYGQAIVAALEGRDIAAALQRAAEEMDRIIERTR